MNRSVVHLQWILLLFVVWFLSVPKNTILMNRVKSKSQRRSKNIIVFRDNDSLKILDV